MKGHSVGNRYAKALLEYAISQGKEKVVMKDMTGINKALSETPDFNKALKNPVLSSSQKHRLLKETFKGVHKISLQLFSLLEANNRMAYLDVMVLAYLAAYEDYLGNIKATVTTAIPISTALKEKVLEKAKALTDKKITLENTIDPAVLGGFVLQLDDLRYDASIAYQLNTLKGQLTQ